MDMMHELTNVFGCVFSEILANGTYASDFNVCSLQLHVLMLCCFTERS